MDGHRDPWGVLVSEVMAQQTQIGRVEERWPAFMAAFPTPAAMAAASPADVIRAWRGLGYNRRALGLHRAALVPRGANDDGRARGAVARGAFPRAGPAAGLDPLRADDALAPRPARRPTPGRRARGRPRRRRAARLHSAQAVTLALAGLARDGIVELDAAGRARLAGSSEPA